MSWQVLIAVSLLFNSFAVLLQRVIMRNDKSDAIAYSIFSQFLTGIFIAWAGLSLGKLTVPDISRVLPNIVIMIVLYTFGNILLNKSLKLIEASEMTVLFASRGLFTILASTVLIHEGLSVKQLIGAILVLVAVVLVTHKNKGIKLKLGEFMVLGAALLFGLANTNDRILLGSFEVYTYVSFAFIAPGLFSVLIYPNHLRHIPFFLKRDMLAKTVGLCLLYAVSAITFFGALQLGNNSSQIAAINQLSTVITVVLAVLILREKGHLIRKIVGGVISMVGVMLIG